MRLVGSKKRAASWMVCPFRFLRRQSDAVFHQNPHRAMAASPCVSDLVGPELFAPAPAGRREAHCAAALTRSADWGPHPFWHRFLRGSACVACSMSGLQREARIKHLHCVVEDLLNLVPQVDHFPPTQNPAKNPTDRTRTSSPIIAISSTRTTAGRDIPPSLPPQVNASCYKPSALADMYQGIGTSVPPSRRLHIDRRSSLIRYYQRPAVQEIGQPQALQG
jgi:hypothetical protein